MKDVNFEKYETLMKDTEDDTKKWKDILFSWIGRINILKCTYNPKEYTVLMQSPSTFSLCFHRTRTNNPNIYMEPQKTPNSQRILEKKRAKLVVSLSLTSDYTAEL